MLRFLRHDQRGVTLPELMTVVSILTVLASIGTVSYTSIRQYSRDIKRVADMDVLQSALELYYQDHFTYPPDTGAGANGLILGRPETLVLDASGFVPQARGKVYLMPVTANPEPNGTAYLYHSYNADGTDCDAAPCARYTVRFTLEGKTTQMGPGVHSISSEGVDADALGQPIALARPDTSLSAIVAGGAGRAVFFFQEEATSVASSPVVQRGSVDVAVPVASGVTLFAIARAAPLSALPQYFLFFFSQPLLLLFRPRRRGYGVVYHALSKLPVDLAIVRLKAVKTGATVRSAVTDEQGRFKLAAPVGSYRVEVIKPGFQFPSAILAEAGEDNGFTDIYHGETIRVSEAGAAVAPNIPLDPLEGDATDKRLLRTRDWRRLQHAGALAGVVTSAATFLAVPSITVGIILLIHIGLYVFFRRIALPKRPPGWGMVYTERTRQPVDRAVVRMFALPYHKMVDSAVTDSRGRYGFLVGPAEVYLTVTKDGFLKTETEPVDLRGDAAAHVIAQDLPLRSFPKKA